MNRTGLSAAKIYCSFKNDWRPFTPLGAVFAFILLPLMLTLPLSGPAGEEQDPKVSELKKAIAALVASVRRSTEAMNGPGQPLQESPRFSMANDGHLRSLGAPPSHYFPVTSVVPADPEATARNFMQEQGKVFGIRSPAVDFSTLSVKTRGSRCYVRFQQTYRGLPVFASEIIVQLNTLGGVESVLSDIMRDTEDLDAGNVSTVPSISEDDARQAALRLLADKNPTLELQASEAALMIYEPSVVGNSGPEQLVWQITVLSVGKVGVNELVLVDAHSGKIALHYSQIMGEKS